MVEVLTICRSRRVRGWISGAGAGLFLFFLLVNLAPQVRAAQLNEAEVTRIIKQVEVLPEQAAPRPATVKDLIRGGTAVRTGVDSRTELTFPDQTLTRLGASTTFSFNEGTRTIDLGTGAMLLYVPKGSGGAKISTAAVTAAITGTTVMIEYHPPKETAEAGNVDSYGNSGPAFGLVSRKLKPTDLSSAYIKFITLEGVAQIFLGTRPGEPILVPAGHMLLVSPDGSSVNLIEVDLAVLVATSPLIADFPALASAPLIADEIARQQADAAYWSGPYPDDVPPHETIDQAISGIGLLPGGGIAGSEFGPLNTITAPVPYVINGGTQIVTAPTITTGGTTDFGKIYRGQSTDGPAALYFFGAQSTFDSDAGFNTLGEGGSARSPMAAFKFTVLQISGDPVITVPPGGASNLGLVSEGSITTGAGGNLTFAGMNTVMLAAQNGSISLGAGISFSNLSDLFLYARGGGSAITVASPMSNMGVVEMDAEGTVQVNANIDANVFSSFTGTFLTGTGVVTAAAQISITGQTQVNFSLARFALGAGAQVSLNGPTITMDATSNGTLFQNASLLNVNAGTINVIGASPMTFGSATQVDFEAGAGGIQASSEDFVHPGNALIMNSAGNIVVKSITGGSFVGSNGSVTSTGLLNSRDLEVGGNINANQLSALFLNQNFTPSNSTVTVGAGGITPYLPQPGAVHRFNAMTITSTGGINFSGNNFSSTPGANGASLFLTDQTQIFGAGGIVGANFNGGDAAGAGQPPGSGGTLSVTTGGDLSVNGTTISATTGIIATNDPPGGTGGTVNLTSNTGMVTVTNSTIQVSSNDTAGTPNRRSSAKGGNINISSGAATGVAVSISTSAQLRSLLETGAPGPGGIITVNATSLTGNSSINVGGTIEADNGLSGQSAIDIRHSSNAGQITVASNMIKADIIKIATLGDGSTLNINTSTNISAITLLRLYAGSISAANNSTINFSGVISLTGAEIDIAANTVNLIGSGTMVMTGSQAHVFTNIANYTGSGGNNAPNTGMFTGLGAVTMGLDQAPALGPPGGTAPVLSAAALNFPTNRSIDLSKNRPGLPERNGTRPDRPFSP